MPAVGAAPPARSRTGLWIAGGLIVAVVALFIVMSLGGNDEGTNNSSNAEIGSFAGHGLAFDYPSDWKSLGPATFQVNSGDVQWTESFGADPGASGVIVTEYALQKDVAGVSEADLRAELDQLFTSTVAQANGTLTEPLAPTTIAGLSGYKVSFTSPSANDDLITDMVLVFRGTQQWNIQCQYTAADQQDVRPGCEQIWDTFTIEG
ncbi:MAG: hypothetical protein ABI572_03640 [Actinomycetota bacterium]